jgi:hypothetical protein
VWQLLGLKKFKMAAVAMVTKVQLILLKLDTKIDHHSKLCSLFLKFSKWPPIWKWIFTGSKICCAIWRPFWFAMAAILNPKWMQKYKNPPIWGKFGFQVDFVLVN